MRLVENGRGFLLLFLLISNIQSKAQIIWDGGGGDGQWNNPQNWVNDLVPTSVDSVLLDNSVHLGDYTVNFPGGMNGISIASIRIRATDGNKIELTIPSTNTAVPALTLSGSPGLRLEAGAVFLNASGASSGTVLTIADSLIIYNGGRFVHNTRTAHASFLNKLSRAPGTEYGVFEFNVPGTASYTISLAARTYGSLELNALAAGGTKTYLSNGTNPAAIRGDLFINSGTTYALDFAGEIIIGRDLVVEGNLNLSSSSNNNILKLKGELENSGNIFESGTGSPMIELSGNSIQSIRQNGRLYNQVIIRTNNPNGIWLRTLMRVPYRIEMTSGKIISNDTAMLLIDTGAYIISDSATQTCFVDGPIRKLGLTNQAHFLFPVGKGITQRWMAIKNATGDFQVEFMKQSARSISNNLGTGIDHVSSIEHWTIHTSAVANAQVELSFDNVNSGGVSDLSSLRAAQLKNNIWENAGNDGFTGSPGASGSVVSSNVSNFESPVSYFSLASSSAFTNPLPINKLNFWYHPFGEQLRFSWTIQSPKSPIRSELLGSSDGVQYRSVRIVETRNKEIRYGINIKRDGLTYEYYKVKTSFEDSTVLFSDIKRIEWSNAAPIYLQKLIPSDAGLFLKLSVNEATKISIIVFNHLGQRVAAKELFLKPGVQEVFWETRIPKSSYNYLLMATPKFRSKAIGFFFP